MVTRPLKIVPGLVTLVVDPLEVFFYLEGLRSVGSRAQTLHVVCEDGEPASVSLDSWSNFAPTERAAWVPT